MTIATMDQLVGGLANGQRIAWNKSNPGTGTSGVWMSLWKQGGSPGAAATPPSAGEIPTNSTAGALPFTNPGSGSAYLAQCAMGMAAVGIITMYDRLWHNSGLSGTVTTSQTINSAALTRPDANGNDVECWLEVNTATGSTSRTASITYTDGVNGTGRTGSLTLPATPSAQRMIPMTNQAGDYNVKSIQSVTLSGTTGTAGDFGFVLLRRIAEVPLLTGSSAVDRDAFGLGLPQIYNNACLALFVMCSTTNQGPFTGMYSIAVG